MTEWQGGEKQQLSHVLYSTLKRDRSNRLFLEPATLLRPLYLLILFLILLLLLLLLLLILLLTLLLLLLLSRPGSDLDNCQSFLKTVLIRNST